MPRLKFGAFLAPHHPIGEHPMLQFRRDLAFVEQLDELGYDEFWCGEHHSSGWEMIASPEMFLAAAGEHTKRIKLATGVISLPYHHPYNVAQRMVQLDHMTGGRAIFGSGPGALPSDAHTLGSMSSEGLTALPTQWGFAEAAAKKHGTTVDRKNWRVLLNWHIAETREKAREEAKHGLMRWHNEYIHGTLKRPGSVAYKSPEEAVDEMGGPGSAAVI